MCYFKSEVEKFEALMAHYAASFDSITPEMEMIKERFSVMLRKDDALKSIGMGQRDELSARMMAYNEKGALPATLTKQELTEMRWYQRLLSAYGNPERIERFYENGFDYFPTHVITAGEPDKFKLFNWGLVPFYQKNEEKAMEDRRNTLNCISEEMYEKPSFRDPAAKGQRCLIPITGFFEWRHVDKEGTIKIPYFVTFRDGQVRSMAGLYTRWKYPDRDEYYYSYTVLTTKANTIMEYVHNAKKRMPVFIHPGDEKAWLNRDLSKADVMELCRPYDDPMMRAYTIGKMPTPKTIHPNSPEVLKPFNYNTAIQEANDYFLHGDKKKGLAVFRDVINQEKAKEEHLELALRESIMPELSMA